MKLQFSVSTLLLATAMVAISIAGALWVDLSPLISKVMIFYLSPIWLPIAFFAYALGRKRLTVWLVVMMLVCEIASVFISHWAILYYD